MKVERIYTYCLDYNGVLLGFYRISFASSKIVDVFLYLLPEYLNQLPILYSRVEANYYAIHTFSDKDLYFNYECLNLSPYEIEFYTRKYNYYTNNQNKKS